MPPNNFDGIGDLTSVERMGYVNAHVKGTSTAYRFAMHESERLHEAWTNGAAFFTGSAPGGERVTVKLATIEALILWTPDACAKAESFSAEDRARDRHRRLVEGD